MTTANTTEATVLTATQKIQNQIAALKAKIASLEISLAGATFVDKLVAGATVQVVSSRNKEAAPREGYLVGVKYNEEGGDARYVVRLNAGTLDEEVKQFRLAEIRGVVGAEGEPEANAPEAVEDGEI